jgi:type VI secretion system protein ImpB
MASVNDKLERVRKPRVHIKYDVETEGAEVEKELPFTVGVLGDYAGNNAGEDKKSLKDRKFVSIDRDNFDAVMNNIKPGIQAKVDNTLDASKSELSVNLQFNSMDDFEPLRVIDQVPALKALKAQRDKLRDLLTKVDRSDELEILLEDILKSSSALEQLAGELDKTGGSTND